MGGGGRNDCERGRGRGGNAAAAYACTRRAASAPGQPTRARRPPYLLPLTQPRHNPSPRDRRVRGARTSTLTGACARLGWLVLGCSAPLDSDAGLKPACAELALWKSILRGGGEQGEEGGREGTGDIRARGMEWVVRGRGEHGGRGCAGRAHTTHRCASTWPAAAKGAWPPCPAMCNVSNLVRTRADPAMRAPPPPGARSCPDTAQQRGGTSSCC